jgi:hypothetical protein
MDSGIWTRLQGVLLLLLFKVLRYVIRTQWPVSEYIA